MFWHFQIKIGYFQNMEFWSLGHKVQVEAKLKLIFYEKAKKKHKKIILIFWQQYQSVLASKRYWRLTSNFVSFSENTNFTII